MPINKEQILSKALKLPPIERAELVEELLSSFEFSSRQTIDALWAEEAESRIDAFEQGKILAISVKDVFGKIEKQKNNQT